MKIRRIISAHEHLGIGRLTFSQGNYTIYNAAPEALESDLEPLIKLTGCEDFGYIVYPQMPYKKYSTRKEYEVTTKTINANLYNDTIKLLKNKKCFPFIYLRCSDPVQKNESLIKQYRNFCYGLKIHPEAEILSIDQFHNSRVLELAAEYNLPVTIHCGRPGGVFDYNVIKKELFDEVIQRNIHLNIAHIGFFAETIISERLPEQIYTDISPLGVIIDQCLLSKGTLEIFQEKFNEFSKRNSRQIMYGGDFPYNIQRWSDGSIHGQNRIEDFNELKIIINKWSGIQIENLFYQNCLRFLNLNI